jgi:hypothetical protein
MNSTARREIKCRQAVHENDNFINSKRYRSSAILIHRHKSYAPCGRRCSVNRSTQVKKLPPRYRMIDISHYSGMTWYVFVYLHKYGGQLDRNTWCDCYNKLIDLIFYLSQSFYYTLTKPTFAWRYKKLYNLHTKHNA